jgi:hypothetical protein
MTPRRRIIGRALCAVTPLMIGLGCAGAATAQSAGREHRSDIELSAKATYDSNVARGDDLVAGVRDINSEDVVYSPRVKVDVARPVGRGSAFVQGTIGYDFYQDNEELSRENLAVTAGVNAPVGPCDAALKGGVSRQQSDLADLTLTTTENTQQTVNANLNVGCATSGGIGGVASVGYAETTNSALQDLVDSRTNSFSAGVTYSNRILGTVSLMGGYQEVDYDGGPLISPPGFEAYNVGLSISRPIGARLSGSAALGYQSLRSKGPGDSDYDGVSGQASLNYRATPRLSASLSYMRGAVATIQQGSNYTVTETVKLQGAYTVSSRIKTNLGASWTERSYRGDGLGPQPLSVDEDEITSIFSGVSINIGRRSSLAFDGSREVRETDVELFNYTAYRFGVSAVTAF